MIAGAGPLEASLRETARRLGLGPKVVFLSPTPEIARAYRAADAFVLPSFSEGLSNSLLEAMASGLAVVASRVGGTAEAVKDGDSGLLFDRDDMGGLRRQLVRLMREPALVERLGRRAREEALGRFSLAAVAQRYRELYGMN